MFPVKIIVLIVFTSGLIAFLGDRIGHYIGRRRLSFLKLRPRNTAIVFTIITGILIAILSVGVLLIISSNARTAFFGLEKLRNELSYYEKLISGKNQQIKETSARLEELKNSETSMLEKIENLRNEKVRLSEDVEKLKILVGELITSLKSVRGGEIFVKVSEILLTQTTTGAGSDSQIDKFLKEMLSKADYQLRLRAKLLGSEIPEKQRILWLSQEELTQAIKFIKEHAGPLAVRLSAGHNTAIGEIIVVHFEIFENRLIFKKGEIIFETKMETRLPDEALLKKFQEALTRVRSICENKGLVPDKRGVVGTVPYAKISRILKIIKKSSYPEATLTIKAGGNIFTAGPLELAFSVNGRRVD